MNTRKQRALAALIRSPTREQAAKAAGVGVSTLRRWMIDDPEFRNAYRIMLTEIVQDAAAQSKQTLKAALDTITEIMEHGNSDLVRLRAATAAIDAALKIDERADVEVQLAELRKEINDLCR